MSSGIEDLNDDECQEPCCDDAELAMHAENRRVWEDNEQLRARVAELEAQNTDCHNKDCRAARSAYCARHAAEISHATIDRLRGALASIAATYPVCEEHPWLCAERDCASCQARRALATDTEPAE